MAAHPDPQTKTDPEIEALLDAMGARARAEPDAGFEHRIATGARTIEHPARGRRRTLVGPLALGGIAALIAVGVILVPTASPTDPMANDPVAADIAEMSFTLFDDVLGIDGAFAAAGVPDAMDPSTLDEWFVEGDAL